MIYQTLISSIAVGVGGAANITFTSIPATYTDLTLILSARTVTGLGQETMRVQLNADTGNNYSTRTLYTDTVNSVSSTSYTSIPYFLNSGWLPGDNNTASVFGNIEITFPNYTSSANKLVQFNSTSETNLASATGILAVAAGTWANSAAITSIKLYGDYGQNFARYTNAYLYGTLKGTGGATAS